MGLAFASALVVLIASGVAVSRLGSDDEPRSSESASSVPAPETPSPGSTAADQGNASDEATTSAPVPPPVPASDSARGTARPLTGTSGTSKAAASAKRSPGSDSGASPAGASPSGGSPASPASPSGASPSGGWTAGGSTSDGSTSDGSASGDSASGGSGSGDAPTQGSGTGGGSSPPSRQQDPESASLLAASVSVGEGTNGAVVGAGIGDRPETDVTVGDNTVVGDAPPSDGTAVDLGGRFLHPPPTVPTLPG